MKHDTSASSTSRGLSGTNPSRWKRLVLVGHCNADQFLLRNALGRALPEATIEAANNSATLDLHREPNRLWLVNRVLEGSFDTGSGLDLIRANASGPGAPATILISNFPEAQAEAQALGARPGFGKGQLYEERTLSRLREAAALGSAS